MFTLAEHALKNVIFLYSPKVAHPWRLYGIKITRFHEVKNLTFGTFKALSIQNYLLSIAEVRYIELLLTALVLGLLST